MLTVDIEDLYLYCRVDSEEQMLLARQIAEECEATLLDKGIPVNDKTRRRFSLTVKAMTLHEMDHPGEEYPRGIREKINDLKFNH